MSPEQCRAARAWLDWSQHNLAAKARVSDSTIRDFEAGRRVPHPNNLTAIRRVLEAAQIWFQNTDDGTPLAIGKEPAVAVRKSKKRPKRR
jgi:ribosome-binding protein aMBF1 (putative translation factor)